MISGSKCQQNFLFADFPSGDVWWLLVTALYDTVNQRPSFKADVQAIVRSSRPYQPPSTTGTTLPGSPSPTTFPGATCKLCHILSASAPPTSSQNSRHMHSAQQAPYMTYRSGPCKHWVAMVTQIPVLASQFIIHFVLTTLFVCTHVNPQRWPCTRRRKRKRHPWVNQCNIVRCVIFSNPTSYPDRMKLISDASVELFIV